MAGGEAKRDLFPGSPCSQPTPLVQDFVPASKRASDECATRRPPLESLPGAPGRPQTVRTCGGKVEESSPLLHMVCMHTPEPTPQPTPEPCSAGADARTAPGTRRLSRPRNQRRCQRQNQVLSQRKNRPRNQRRSQRPSRVRNQRQNRTRNQRRSQRWNRVRNQRQNQPRNQRHNQLIESGTNAHLGANTPQTPTLGAAKMEHSVGAYCWGKIFGESWGAPSGHQQIGHPPPHSELWFSNL
jgi:hypothetical protein